VARDQHLAGLVAGQHALAEREMAGGERRVDAHLVFVVGQLFALPLGHAEAHERS
jgi:hypothetical protein